MSSQSGYMAQTGDYEPFSGTSTNGRGESRRLLSLAFDYSNLVGFLLIAVDRVTANIVSNTCSSTSG